MKITIFGATGRTGRPLVEQALAAGHEVTAFVRDPARLPIQHERLRTVQGDVTDPAQVSAAIAGADAVLSALGHTATSTTDVQTVATRHILAAMQQHGVQRLVSLTGAGVADAEDTPKLWNRAIGLVLRLSAPAVLADADEHAALIRRSDRDWVIVRAPMLTDGPHTGKYRVGVVGQGTGPRIARADVADFMLKQISDSRYLRRAPMISN